MDDREYVEVFKGYYAGHLRATGFVTPCYKCHDGR
jgi:hypothetical protein